MDADIAQIKMLLWAILGLQIFFIVGNILCRIVGCGERKSPNYNDLWQRGKIDEILSKTKERLETHPRDVDALYFRAKALIASGLPESARRAVEELVRVEPSLANVGNDWLSALDNPGNDS